MRKILITVAVNGALAAGIVMLATAVPMCIFQIGSERLAERLFGFSIPLIIVGTFPLSILE